MWTFKIEMTIKFKDIKWNKKTCRTTKLNKTIKSIETTEVEMKKIRLWVYIFE